jgi:uncharacterized SAM-binding protein YcdF (DUF218 family)
MDSTQETTDKGSRLRLRLFLRILGAIALLGAATVFVILLDVGKWLVREDPLQHASAIAVLSGNIPTRALEAAELYRNGYAKEIWLTHPGVNTGEMKVLGIAYPSEADFNVRVLRKQGVPAKAIHILDTPIVNTAEELDVISAALKSRGGQRVIVVTNKAHTRRVHILWVKYFGTRGDVIVHGASTDAYDGDHWWRDSGNMGQVTHEVLGIMNAWAGMPVQPGPHVPDEVVAQGSDHPEYARTD